MRLELFEVARGMGQQQKRPVYLNLLQIRLPVGGVLSICHRISGVLLVCVLPPAILFLQLSLSGPEGFQVVRAYLETTTGRWLTLGILGIMLLHFLAGIRHLFMDLEIGITRTQARASAWVTFILGVAGVLLFAVGLW